MKRFLVCCLTFGVGTLAAISESAHAGLVDLSLNPETSTAAVGDLVRIELAAMTQEEPIADVAAIEAILDWDPAFLELLGIDNTNDAYAWSTSDFLLDPDGINDDLSDGDALYTALSQLGTPADVPISPGWVVTTFVFRALAPTGATTVSLVDAYGDFGETRVLGSEPGQDLTGNTEAAVEVAISEPELAGLVDLSLHPETSTANVGDFVAIELVARAQEDPPAAVAAIEAILDWDPAFLELVGIDNTNDAYAWHTSDFLLDPDGINDDHTDGDALYTALSQLGTPADVPTATGWVVTTFVFRALAPTDATIISLVDAFGDFGQTRVLGFIPGKDLTGNIDSTVEVEILGPVGVGATLDVHPGSCPNPINVRSRGITPVALVGSTDFDVSTVDPASLSLMRGDGVGGAVAPTETHPDSSTRIADVATPFEGEACECHSLAEDGVDDLLVFFDTASTVEVLQMYGEQHRSIIEVVLSGQLYDGTPFEVSDCVKVVSGTKPGSRGSR